MLSLECRGTLDFDDGVDKSALLAHLAKHLQEVKAREVTISCDRCTFGGGFFRGVNNWNILIPFGRGELIVNGTKHAVRYRLSVRQLVYTATIMIAFVSMESWSDIRHDPAILFLLAIGWFLLIGGNLMVGLPRFRRFLRDAVDTVPTGKQSKLLEEI